MEDYRRNPHSVTLLNYHFVWCPKRRKAVLKGDIKLRAPSIIFDLCQENNWRLVATRERIRNNARSYSFIFGIRP